jgi:glycine cleavage system H protein
MEFPNNLYFTEDHEWTSSLNGSAKIGISAFAIEQLGDIVHIELPEVGKIFAAKDPFGTVESTKTVSDLYMPGKAKVVEINKEILEKPDLLTQDPYHRGWLVKVELDQEIKGLMTSKQYETYIKDH